MTDQFVAEIRLFPFNFAPLGWAFCNGQLLAISQNTALFSLVGTFYGGNGTSNFALPNLQGNVAVSQGQGPGLSPYNVGDTLGKQSVTLLQSQLPQHQHALSALATSGTTDVPTGAFPAMGQIKSGRGGFAVDTYAAAASGTATTLSPSQLGATGGNGAHNNLQPYLVLNFCIALQGIFPARA